MSQPLDVRNLACRKKPLLEHERRVVWSNSVRAEFDQRAAYEHKARVVLKRILAAKPKLGKLQPSLELVALVPHFGSPVQGFQVYLTLACHRGCQPRISMLLSNERWPSVSFDKYGEWFHIDLDDLLAHLRGTGNVNSH